LKGGTFGDRHVTALHRGHPADDRPALCGFRRGAKRNANAQCADPGCGGD
jgi:hypothetical protein